MVQDHSLADKVEDGDVVNAVLRTCSFSFVSQAHIYLNRIKWEDVARRVRSYYYCRAFGVKWAEKL